VTDGLPTSKLLAGHGDLEFFSDELDRIRAGLGRRINADPESVEKGLAQLVMTVIDLLRQLMERQALRRIEGGALSDDEVERLGETFMKLAERMEELKREFGLKDEDLNLNLGPLGDLM
jgi:gas vesicle protein GvpK